MAETTSEKELVEQLKNVPLFAQTSVKQRKTLAKLGKVVNWREGSQPIKQGSKGAAFFLILNGQVEVSRDGTSLARLGDGDFVGEVALLTNQPPQRRRVGTGQDNRLRLRTSRAGRCPQNRPGARPGPAGSHGQPTAGDAVGTRDRGRGKCWRRQPGRTMAAARSMAAATSPSTGYSSDRPTTSPRTLGTSMARAHEA